MKATNLFFLLSLFICISTLSAQNTAVDVYEPNTLETQSGDLLYRILAPKNFDKTKSYPLVLFLHGAGERGSDNQLQLVHGASFFASDQVQDNYEAFVVFPQCPKEVSWSPVDYQVVDNKMTFIFPTITQEHTQQTQLMQLVNYMRETYPIDSSRLYVGGLSMGGMGTLEMIRRYPETFAAAFAICGGANPLAAGEIKNTPLWLFHGEKDVIVAPTYSTELYEALKNENADVKITLYPEAGHDSWTATFKEPDLLRWLFSNSRELD